MKFFIDERQWPSSSTIKFYSDGSFGPRQKNYNFNFEIDLANGGSISIICSLEEKKCYCLEGYTWKSWKNLKHTNIDVSKATNASLLFEFDSTDMKKYGLLLDLNLKPTSFDNKKNLVLYGSILNDNIIKFAEGQYVCLTNNCIVGIIIDCSALS